MEILFILVDPLRRAIPFTSAAPTSMAPGLASRTATFLSGPKAKRGRQQRQKWKSVVLVATVSGVPVSLRPCGAGTGCAVWGDGIAGGDELFAARLVTGRPSRSRSSYIWPVVGVFQVLAASFLVTAMVAWVWQDPGDAAGLVEGQAQRFRPFSADGTARLVHRPGQPV